ncbi:hypothetical protein [Fusobacterium sp.]|uniref:YczE/YyaS/YitT family protein n=1 Tax=Fusobacterium sp. TaxID=68766 RepID=UPI002902A332|nr:hypothetical protein [Fusobacterium sp.]MDU1910175.1 hypothetical protein [Fusobacterium sp.]
MNSRKKEIMKYGKLISGMFMCAFGCILILKSDLGLSPWDVLHQGISKTIGITIGQASIGLGIMIVAVDIFLGQPIGLGTVLNFLSIGIFMDLILYLDFIPVEQSIIYRILLLIVGIFFYAYGTFLNMVQGMGCGPRDGFLQILTKRTNISVGMVKNCIEVFAFSIGWILGGKLGVGTIVTALGLGISLAYIFKFYDIDLKELKHRNIKEEVVHLKKVFF